MKKYTFLYFFIIFRERGGQPKLSSDAGRQLADTVLHPFYTLPCVNHVFAHHIASKYTVAGMNTCDRNPLEMPQVLNLRL